MASHGVEVVGHRPTLLPDGPTQNPYTDASWATLLAILEAILPSIRREAAGAAGAEPVWQRSISDEEYHRTLDHLTATMVDAPNGDDWARYLAERLSEIPRFQDLLRRTLGVYAHADARRGLGVLLAALNTRLGCKLLTGYTTSFHEQPVHVREEILRRWRDSYLPLLNTLHSQMTVLAQSLWLKTSPIFPALAGFPPVPEHSKPAAPHDYDFLQFASASEPETIETDIVIVGSGCGGAVCAKNLAEAGHRVLVVDKAYHFPPAQYPMTEEAANIHLFNNGGTDGSDDKSIRVLAGSAWGGGGTVNWSASLQTQAFVRKEWAHERGLAFFETAEFQSCLDRVCERMGVSADHVRHNHGNRVLLEGARKLGYHAKAVPQNTGGAAHDCGHCTLGCGSDQKRGPVSSWLPDAAKAGARFVEGFTVERVIFDAEAGVKTAMGVQGRWVSRSRAGVDGPASGQTERELVVRAKKVVVACGALWSPMLLRKSGLENRHIGQHLYLHPVNTVNAIFREDVRPWEGGILTSACTSFEDLDLQGHGVKLEATAMLPSLNLVLFPWTSGLAYKTLALRFRHMNGYIALARDRDPGQVYPDPVSGRPRIRYTPSAFDRAHLLEGVVALCKMVYVEGAQEIHLMNSAVAPFVTPRGDDAAAPSITDPAFAAWLREVRRAGNRPPAASFASAHQMGTCRMGADPTAGVVDPRGRVWEAASLYVADASVFPSASGVNPMITTMAISDHIARCICEDLQSEAGVAR